VTRDVFWRHPCDKSFADQI